MSSKSAEKWYLWETEKPDRIPFQALAEKNGEN